MAEEGPARREQEPGEGSDVHVLGLIAEPGVAEKVARKVASQLPELLTLACAAPGTRGDTWRVEVIRRLLPLDPHGVLPLLPVGQAERELRDWDVAVVLTELPRRADRSPILADCAPQEGVSLISLPAMGAVQVCRRTRAMLVHLVAAYHSRRTSTHRASTPPGMAARSVGALSIDYRLIDERERGGEEEPQEQRTVDANVRLEGVGLHLTLPGRWGQARLLAGMVRANRPWRLVPSLSPALAAAMAGSAFGLFYSSIWQLADVSGAGRLALVNAFAVLAMISWIVLANGLLERSPSPALRAFSALYNAATVLTVCCGVVVMFLLLLTAAFLGACIIIPPEYLARMLHHPAGMSDLATISWLAACLGTLAGALGSGLADAEVVRDAAFSRSERRRQDWREEQEAQSEEGADAAAEWHGDGRTGTDRARS